ncbi:MAG: amidohydrolase family protein [Myxococcota bacterium]
MASAERLISSDDHVDLAHDAIKANLASKFHDAYDAALMEFGMGMAKAMSSEANALWRKQQELPDAEVRRMDSLEGRNYAAAGRPGHTDAKARLEDLDADGIDKSVMYCEVSAFRYLYLLKDGNREATRAFNTTMHQFAEVDRDRMIVSYQIPIHDIEAAVAEVKWVAEMGGKSLQLPVYPAELGLPDYWDKRYDPLWEAITETNLPICLHIGLNTQLESLAQRDPTPQKGIFVGAVALTTAEPLGMFIMGGVFERFPKLKVVFVEPGLGWVDWWLYIVDDLQARQGYEFPAITKPPSHYFHQNVFLTFIDEPNAYRLATERLGVDNIMWSSDYPHPVTSWPRSQEIVNNMFDGIPAEDRAKIVCGNATRVWNL